MIKCPTCGSAMEVLETRGEIPTRRYSCIQDPRHPRLTTKEIPAEELAALQSAVFRNNFLMLKLNELTTIFNHGEKK